MGTATMLVSTSQVGCCEQTDNAAIDNATADSIDYKE